MGIRLEAGAQTVGVLFLNYRNPRQFSVDDVAIASILGTYAATAVQRARLFTIERRLVSLSHLGGLLQGHDYDSTKQEIVRLAAQELRADSATLHQYDPDTEQFIEPDQASVTWPPSGRLEKPRSTGLSAHVMRDGSLWVNNIDDAPWKDLVQTIHLRDTQTKAFMGIRLGTKEQALGVLFLNYRVPRQFSTNDTALASVLGVYAATAFHRARLQDEIQRRANQMGALNAISTQLLSASYTVVKDAVVEIAATHMPIPHPSVSLLQYDAAREDFLDLEQFSATYPKGGRLERPRSDGISAFVIRTKKALAVPNVEHEEWRELANTTHLLESATKAFIGIPLQAGGETLGVLFF